MFQHFKNFPYFLQKFRKIILNFVQILLDLNEISPEFRQNARRKNTAILSLRAAVPAGHLTAVQSLFS